MWQGHFWSDLWGGFDDCQWNIWVGGKPRSTLRYFPVSNSFLIKERGWLLSLRVFLNALKQFLCLEYLPSRTCFWDRKLRFTVVPSVVSFHYLLKRFGRVSVCSRKMLCRNFQKRKKEFVPLISVGDLFVSFIMNVKSTVKYNLHPVFRKIVCVEYVWVWVWGWTMYEPTNNYLTL